jgi:hypothetical protein
VKSVANFVTLNLEPDPLTPDGGVGEWPLLAVLAAWVLIAAVIASDLPRAR